MQIEQYSDKIIELGKSCGLTNSQIQVAMQRVQPGTNAKFQDFLEVIAETLHKFETENDKEYFMNFVAKDLTKFIREIKWKKKILLLKQKCILQKTGNLFFGDWF